MSEKELRELDAWIAEHVMGWHKVKTGDNKSLCSVCGNGFGERHKHYVPDFHSSTTGSVPFYHSDPAAAMQVLEKCVNELCEQDQEETVSVGMEVPYFVVEKTNTSKSMRVEASTLPLSICLFAKQLFSNQNIPTQCHPQTKPNAT